MDDQSISPDNEKIRIFLEDHGKRARTETEITSFLSSFDSVTFDRRRKELAKPLGLRPGTLDELFKQSRPEGTDTLSGSSLEFPEVEPWPEPVDGAALLNELREFFKRYIVLSTEGLTIATLWVVFSWIFDLFDTCPILFVTSPQKRCGKTTLLGLLTRLLSRVLAASNITASALFRVIEKAKPSLVMDEADAFVKDSEDLRGIVNSGHTRTSAFVIRTVGDDHEPRKFSTWAPKVFAGIGSALPETLEDRSIRLELKRKTKTEKVSRIRGYVVDPQCREIVQKIARWTQDHEMDFMTQDANIPEIDNDRAYDNWTPLAVIADVAGGQWPGLIKEAFLAIEGGADPTDTEPLSIELLRGIKRVFTDKNVDRLSTHDLVEALRTDPESPWDSGINNGRGLDARSLSRFLKPFGIRPDGIRIGNATPNGYKLDWFSDAFSRYIPESPEKTSTGPQSGTVATEKDFSDIHKDKDVEDKKTSQDPYSRHCGSVEDKTPVSEKMESFSEDVDPVSVPFNL